MELGKERRYRGDIEVEVEKGYHTWRGVDEVFLMFL